MSDGIAANQTSQSPLHLRITDGNLTATLGTFTFEAQTVPLTPNATNYVFLDLSQEPPVLTVNTTGFPASAVWTIATAVTNNSKITQLTDSRPQFNKTFSGGGSSVGISGDAQFSKGDGSFGNADSVASGCTVNLDTNIGSGLSITIVNGGVTITQDLDFGVVAAAASFECTSGNLQFTADTGDIEFQATAGNIRFEADGAASQIQLNAPHANFPRLQIFANNAAAIAGGLSQWDLYRTGADPDVVCIVH
ncbi:MAG TPA: hypothetical protein VN682_17085 [Terriglobales bacterium]|nr:hypothetical protein [Terriglobales bacterium]